VNIYTLVYLLLNAGCLGWAIARHRKPLPPLDAWNVGIWAAFNVGLLYMGGAFS